MPLPRPRGDESHDEFIDRCMEDDVMVREFEDEKQRYAICEGIWENRSKDIDVESLKGSKDKKEDDEDYAITLDGEFYDLPVISKCMDCKHYHENSWDSVKQIVATCEAFPDGIPWSIWREDVDHSKPYRGDNGIRYEKR